MLNASYTLPQRLQLGVIGLDLLVSQIVLGEGPTGVVRVFRCRRGLAWWLDAFAFEQLGELGVAGELVLIDIGSEQGTLIGFLQVQAMGLDPGRIEDEAGVDGHLQGQVDDLQFLCGEKLVHVGERLEGAVNVVDAILAQHRQLLRGRVVNTVESPAVRGLCAGSCSSAVPAYPASAGWTARWPGSWPGCSSRFAPVAGSASTGSPDRTERCGI